MHNELSKLNAESANARYDRAWALYRDGKFQEAKGVLNDIANVDGHRVGPKLLLGKIAIDEGNPALAVSYLEPLVDHSSCDYEVLIELGNALYDCEEVNKSRNIYSKAREMDGKRHEAYHCLAYIESEQGSFESAATIAEVGLRNVDSFDGALLLHKAAALSRLELKEFNSAIKHLDLLIERCPEYGIFYYYRSKCQLGLGNREEATTDAATAVKLEPGDGVTASRGADAGFGIDERRAGCDDVWIRLISQRLHSCPVCHDCRTKMRSIMLSPGAMVDADCFTTR